MKRDAFAEIIESSLTHWLAQSWEWDTFPQFGSLVTVTTGKRTLFAIVYHIQTGSMDPVRFPFTYKKTEKELRAEQPQIFEFLKTTFSCLIVGYKEQNDIIYQLAPEPPKIHSFVQVASDEDFAQFFGSNHYLHVLFGATNQVANLDELLLAITKQLQHKKLLEKELLVQFIETYLLLNGNNYRRLKLFLQRVGH